MKTILNYIILPCLIITPIALDIMQTAGPHGGTMKKADNYFIEMKTDDKFLYAYLLDNKQKTMNSKDLICTVRFFLPDSTDINLQLKPFGENGFIGKNIQGYSYCKVIFHLDPQNSVSAMFENQKLVVHKE